MIKPNKNIEELKAYNAAQINAEIILSANETKNYLFKNGYDINVDFSRYPEVKGDTLREELGKKFNVEKDQIIIGNGSTQLLELVVRTYTQKGNKIITFTPSFAMYEIYAKSQNTEIVQVPLNDNMVLDIDSFIKEADQEGVSLIILCNPNNPTGTLIKQKDILKIIDNTSALVIVDEAYMEFTDESESVLDYVNQYDKLIIARTFSKAYGLAALRLGYMISNKEIITNLSKVALPYNVNAVTQSIGVKALSFESKMKNFTKTIAMERDRIITELTKYNYKIYSSFTNFVYMYTTKDIYKYLLENGVLIRTFKNDFYRITVGDKLENDKVISLLGEIAWEKVQ